MFAGSGCRQSDAADDFSTADMVGRSCATDTAAQAMSAVSK